MAKSLTALAALSLLSQGNGASRASSQRRWNNIKERYTRSMNNALVRAKSYLNTNPAAAVQDLKEVQRLYKSGPQTHKKGLSIAEHQAFQAKQKEATRLLEQAKMARGARKLSILNKHGRGNTQKARTIHKRMSRSYGYKR
jgi:hypothetical protein